MEIIAPRSLRSLREHELTLAIRKFCGFCAREYPHLYELRNYISHGIHRIHRNDIIGGDVKGGKQMERIHRICRRLRHDGWRGEKEEKLTFND